MRAKSLTLDVRVVGPLGEFRIKRATNTTDKKHIKALREMIRTLWRDLDRRRLIYDVYDGKRFLEDVYRDFTAGRLVQAAIPTDAEAPIGCGVYVIWSPDRKRAYVGESSDVDTRKTYALAKRLGWPVTIARRLSPGSSRLARVQAEGQVARELLSAGVQIVSKTLATSTLIPTNPISDQVA